MFRRRGPKWCLPLAAAGFMAWVAPAAACGIPSAPLVVATPLAFGLYNAGSASDTDAMAVITVSCVVALDALPAFTIGLTAGASGSFAGRQMAFGSSELGYNLYTSMAHDAVWGDGTGGSVTQSYSAGAGLTTFTVYGSLPRAQYVPSGLYQDTITVRVVY